MSSAHEEQWQLLRRDVLFEVADLTRRHDPALAEMLEALTRAFDHPAPPASILRRLASFRAGQWPLLRNLLDSDLSFDSGNASEIISRATQVLNAADRRRRAVQVEALEIEMEVLETLLRESSLY